MKNVDHSIIITYLYGQGRVFVNVILIVFSPRVEWCLEVSGGVRELDMIIPTPLPQSVKGCGNIFCRSKR